MRGMNRRFCFRPTVYCDILTKSLFTRVFILKQGIDKRTIEKFEYVFSHHFISFRILRYRTLLVKHIITYHLINLYSTERKPLNQEKAHSNMPGFWINSKPSANVVSQSTLLYGNSKPPNIMSQLSTLQGIVTLSRT